MSIDTTNWMKQLLWPVVRNQWKISEVLFPASHNSASYAYKGIGPQWGACQVNTVWRQLELGTRYLDIRICDDVDKEGHLWVSHRYPCEVLEAVFDDIRSFIDLHPEEIVGIRIEKDYDRTLSATGRSSLVQMTQQFFKDMIIDSNAARLMTIAQLLENKLRVLLCPRNLDLSELCSTPCKVVPSWSLTRTDSPGNVLPQCLLYLANSHPQIAQDGSTFTMMEAIITPSTRLILKNFCSSLSIVSRHVRGGIATSGALHMHLVNNKRGCNILSCDFINSRVIACLIHLNVLRTLKVSSGLARSD